MTGLYQTILGRVPSKSNSYRNYGGRFVKSDKVREYERSFTLQYRGYFTVPHGVKFRFIIDVYFANPKSDLDGCFKVVLDLLQDLGAIENDNMCDEIHARKFIDKVNPRIEFKIETL